jgi:hypothetical protein
MSDGDVAMIAAYERQARRMDALAATAPGLDMPNAFRRVAAAFRALAQRVRDTQDSTQEPSRTI